MATIAEAKRRLTIEYRSEGADKVAQDARKVEAGIDGVAVAGQRTERATQSVDRSYASLQRRYDAVARAQQEMARVERIVAQARAQGIGTEVDRTRLIDSATAAINRQTGALRQLANAERMAGAGANDNRRQVLGYQAFDIGQGLMAGTPLAMIAAQQGPQIAQLYASQGGLNALWKDAAGILGGLARAAGPWIGAIAALYGAYRLLTSYSAESMAAVDGTTAALAGQAAPIGSVKSGISDLAGLQKTYADAINNTAATHSAATALMISNTEKEFNAKKTLLELEMRRQDALIKTQQAELAVEAIRLRRTVATTVFTRADLERQGFADPRVGSIPFVRLPDDITGLEKTRDILEKSPINDKIEELRANLTLTELAAQQLREALKATFSDGSLLPGGANSGTLPGGQAIPMPSFRGIDDVPGDVELYKELVKTGEQRLRQLTTESETLGMTAGAAAAYRFEQEAIASAQIRNVELGPDQVATIRKQAEAYGALTDAIAKSRLQQDLAFESSQLFRSATDQSIASRLRSTGQAVDFNSPEALQMRQIERIKELREGVSGFVSDFRSEFLRNGGDIGEAFATAIMNGINRQLEKFIEVGITALTEAIAKQMGLSGGAGFSPSASGFADMLFGNGIAGASRMQAPANNNFPAVASGASYSVANATNFIRQYASSIGIDPEVALKVAKSEGLGAGIWQSNYSRGGFREPSYGPFQLLKGGRGTGFGTGLGNAFMARTGLDPADPANWQQSTSFALDQAREGGWGPWYGAAKVGVGKWDGIGRQAGGVAALTKQAETATQALDNLATGTASATGGLDKLGSDFSSFGSNLSNMFPAAPSGGGGGWLSGLFGALNPAFAGSMASNWLAANPGGYVGLYHDGRYPGQPGSIRRDDLSLYAGAPRYHAGRLPTLGPDEERAIIRKSEPVFRSMEHARQVAGGGDAPSMTVVVNNAPAGTQVREESGRDSSGRAYKRAIIDIVSEGMASGDLDKSAGGRWGIRPPTTRRGSRG